MSEKKEYRELFNLDTTLLLMDDLFQLEKILLEDSLTDRIDVKITFDSVTVSADSFKELLSNTNLPKSTDKLSVNMYRWIDTEDYRGISSGVSISLYVNHINCSIYSLDETWFLGKNLK